MKEPFHIAGKLEIAKGSRLFLNQKRVDLLEKIEATGSINASSKALKMSYQQAWHFIKEMNEISPLPLVKRQRGGANGGGAILTTYAKKVISDYKRLQNDFNQFKSAAISDLGLCFF